MKNCFLGILGWIIPQRANNLKNGVPGSLTLLKMLLFTGVRISELINIKWSDIEEYYDETHGHIITILVNGKGNKQRYTYLLQDEVEDNLEYIRQSQRNNGYLFETAHGNPCNRSNLFVTVKKITG